MAGAVRLHTTAETEVIADGPGDCAPVAGKGARRPQTRNPTATAKGRGGRERWPESIYDREKNPAAARHRIGTRMARHQASGECAERRLPLSVKTIWFAVTDRADHHRHPVVRAAILRAEGSEWAESWSRVGRRNCVAQSTRANHRKKVSNRSSTRCTLSARPATPSSAASREKAGCCTKPATTMAVCRAQPWSVRL